MTTTLSSTILAAGALLLSGPVAGAQVASGRYQPAPRSDVSQTVKSPAPSDLDRVGPQAFSVVLVVGDMQAAAASDDVPQAARKALTDMKDFLPYKSYHLVDTHWSLCCGRAPVVSRLRGPEGQEYGLMLSASVGRGSDQAPIVNVRFQLEEAQAAEPVKTAVEARRRDISAIEAELKRARAELAQVAKEKGEKTREAAEHQRRVNELANLRQEVHATLTSSQSRRGSSRPVIDASFRMDVGETVVVGTSGLKAGGKALIALLTAVPQKESVTR